MCLEELERQQEVELPLSWDVARLAGKHGWLL